MQGQHLSAAVSGPNGLAHIYGLSRPLPRDSHQANRNENKPPLVILDARGVKVVERRQWLTLSYKAQGGGQPDARMAANQNVLVSLAASA
jgi:hypothetical protein